MQIYEKCNIYLAILFKQKIREIERMKSFAAKVEDGVKGEDGRPSVGPVYRNLLSEKGFPPRHSDITTTWDIFRFIFLIISHGIRLVLISL